MLIQIEWLCVLNSDWLSYSTPRYNRELAVDFPT
jgi:hypothetical protein